MTRLIRAERTYSTYGYRNAPTVRPQGSLRKFVVIGFLLTAGVFGFIALNVAKTYLGPATTSSDCRVMEKTSVSYEGASYPALSTTCGFFMMMNYQHWNTVQVSEAYTITHGESVLGAPALLKEISR